MISRFICAICLLSTLPVASVAVEIETEIVLRRNHHGAFAIPKMTSTRSGSLVIVYQDRSGGDWGKRIEAFAIRSDDAGRTWSAPIALMPDNFPLADQSVLKPTGLVANLKNGDLITFVSRSPLRNADGKTVQERWFYANIQETRRLGRAWFQLTSKDDGRTWSEPRDITQQLIKRPHWQEWSPVHTGLQLQRGKHAGRLVVPVRCYCPDQDPSVHNLKFQTNSVIFSDDGGVTWTPGGRSQPRFGECSIAERTDGGIYMNQRVSPGQPGFRWRAVSLDGGNTFFPTRNTGLTDQRCHAGITTLDLEGRRIFLMSCVPGKQRKGLTLCVSHNEGETWTVNQTIHAGHAAYSDLVVLPSGKLVCVFETGETTSRRDLAVARFDFVPPKADPPTSGRR